jgi:UDP-N-acetylmuramate dehydrogenase
MPTPSSTYSLKPGVSLAERTTFRVPAVAAWLAEIETAAALPELLARPEVAGLQLLALGEGSNTLFSRDYDGLVLHFANSGIKVLEDGEPARVRVAAGEDWDGFVRWSLQQGYAGLENLIFIPGSVGAAPIQNIGAYGAEVKEFVAEVEAWDREAQGSVRLDNRACEFGYRNSIFKREPGRYFITAVVFALPRRHAVKVDYAGLPEELKSQGVTSPTAKDVARAVEALRRRKLPDPALIPNAGSFFKNPVLPAERAADLLRAHPKMPTYHSSEGNTKISAAWLIEACGFKGVRQGDAGVSSQHALVLVNYGRATGGEIWSLAQRVRDTVAGRFGITLEPEPLVL